MIPIPESLKPVFNFLVDVFRALSSYTPGILAVLLSYFILVNIEQGRDVIIQIGEYPGTGVVSVIAVCCWAYFLWYSTRLLGYQNETQTTFINPTFYHHLPRLIAFMGLAVIQVAILSLPTIRFIETWPELKKYFEWYAPVLLLFHVMIYAAVSSFFHFKKLWWRIIVVVLVFAYGVFSILHADTDEPTYKRHMLWLPIISTIVFMLQIAGLVYTIIRRNKVGHSGKQEYLVVSLGTWNLYRIGPMDENTANFERLFFRIFNWLFLAVGIYFIVLVSAFEAAVLAGPFSILIIALIVIFGSTNFLAFIAAKLKMNLLIIMISVAIVAGKLYSERYVIQLPDAKNSFKSRLTLNEYFHAWIDAKQSKIRPYKKYPVYIILSDGGASRSAYWVASVLSKWQDESDSIPDNKFSDHLFALSGASGGSVGNATFYALLDSLNRAEKKFELYPRAKKFLYNDFLSFSIATYVGLDLTGNFIPFLSSRDRAEAIEYGLIHASEIDSIGMHGSFGKMFSKFIPTKAELPILFMNVTEVQEGMPAVVSNIKLEGFSERLDILNEVDPMKDISLATAAMLSSRFPYISPAGRIGDRYYVDGGYFDNSGAGVVHEMLQEIQQIMKEGDKKYADIYEKLEFHVVHVSNTPLTKSELKGIHPLANDLAAPVITVLNTYNSQTVVNDARLRVFLEKEWNQQMDSDVNLYDQDSVSFPMSWVISDYNLYRMDDRLKETLPELRKKYMTVMEQVVVVIDTP